MIPIIKPFLDEKEAEAARRVILSGWVTQGPEVKSFEEEFAAYAGSRFACAVANCTAALHLALKAVGVGPGDEVITVSHSFVATANSVRYCGAVPVFVDVEDDTVNIDPSLVQRAVTGRTRAILCVHQGGMPCNLAEIVKIGRENGIPVVEDAACAAGSEILWEGEWQKIGRPHGDVACFSFHPRKIVTTGDGGMLTTNDPGLDRKFRLWRQHSMSVPDTARHSSNSVIFEGYGELGYNYRMTDMQAAVGRVQVKKIDGMVLRRRELAARYRETLSTVTGLKLPTEPGWARSNWQSFLVKLPDGADQMSVMQRMLDAGVSSRRGIMCAHREAAYAAEQWRCGASGCAGGTGRPCEHLKASERAQDTMIILPLYHQMSAEDQDKVVSALVDAIQIR